MALTISNTKPRSVFQLKGQDENSATYALGWVLEQSMHLRNLLMNKIFQEKWNTHNADHAEVELQRHDSDGGFTDLEMKVYSDSDKVHCDFHFVLEAKRWWDVPSAEQLQKYQPRLTEHRAVNKGLVSVSAAEADSEQAMRLLPKDIGGIPITHISWKDLQRLAGEAYLLASGFEEKLWLRQLIEHLKGFVFMERITDNQVYVVALSTDRINPENNYTWVNVVEENKYFHPAGNGHNNWPVQPPNYIGFRYDGKLQSVHHIKKVEKVRNLAEYNSRWPNTAEYHFVYSLGKSMKPPVEIRSGNIWSRRLTCAIDTLLSGDFTTVVDAAEETKRRLSEIS